MIIEVSNIIKEKITNERAKKIYLFLDKQFLPHKNEDEWLKGGITAFLSVIIIKTIGLVI